MINTDNYVSFDMFGTPATPSCRPSRTKRALIRLAGTFYSLGIDLATSQTKGFNPTDYSATKKPYVCPNLKYVL